MRKAAIIAAALAMMAAGCNAPDGTLTAEEFRGMDKASQSMMIDCQYQALEQKTTKNEAMNYGLELVDGSGDWADMQAEMWSDGYGPGSCDVLLPDFQGGE